MGKHCIFMVVNDAFAIGAIVTLYSFLKNNTWYDEDIIIGCGADEGWGLSDENKEMLQNLYHKLRIVDLRFNEFYDIYDSLIPIAQSGTGFEMTVYKFHAFRLTDYQRVVVFDADMLVLGNIKELFEMDMEFGGLYEVKNEDFSNDIFKKRTNEYFNVGVMVIGKKYLNEETIIKCDNLLKSPEIFENSKIPHYGGLYPEQDILNVLTENENVILIPRTYSADRFFCDENNTKDVKIVHYLKYLKPWRVFNGEYEYQGWTQDEWEKYFWDYVDWRDNYTLVLSDNVIKYPKKYEDKDKYLVVTCAKNENEYIREWIQHYLNLNFDKIIICDNNDDESLLDVISDYINEGVVEVFDCRGFKIFQSHIMSMFCMNGHYKWCGYFDCDEFLELNAYSDIKEYLKDKEGECIAFNWVMFDCNGQLERIDGPVQKRFLQPYYPLINIENSFVKCLMKGGHFKYADIENSGGHLFVCENKKKIRYNFGGYYLTNLDGDNLQAMLPLRYKEGYLKHYYTKSFEEWHQKSQRGWPDRYGVIKTTRFFRLLNNDKPKRERYRNSLFIDEKTFSNLHDNYDGGDDVRFFIFENKSKYVYAFLVRVMYVMSLKEDCVFIVEGEDLDDESYNLLLECAFVTNNKLAIVKDDSEVGRVFKKYCGDGVINYWKKSI